MPTIEERARDMLNATHREYGRGGSPVWTKGDKRQSDYIVEAFCRALEAHDATLAEFEAFKREVSDAASEALEAMVSSGTVAHERAVVGHNTIARFILPKPVDPLAECFSEALTGTAANAASYRDEAQDFCAALAKRGGRIVFKEVGNAD